MTKEWVFSAVIEATSAARQSLSPRTSTTAGRAPPVPDEFQWIRDAHLWLSAYGTYDLTDVVVGYLKAKRPTGYPLKPHQTFFMDVSQ